MAWLAPERNLVDELIAGRRAEACVDQDASVDAVPHRVARWTVILDASAPLALYGELGADVKERTTIDDERAIFAVPVIADIRGPPGPCLDALSSGQTPDTGQGQSSRWG